MSNTNKYIIDLVNECPYNPSFRDYVIKILIELSCQRGITFYKTVPPGSQNKIIGIKYPMSVRCKGNSYEIKIIIYINSEFPNKPPDFYVDNNGDPNLAVNPKNVNVNPENFKIMTNKLFNWARSTSIQEILTEIFNSFEANFPLYKSTTKPQQSNQSINMYNQNSSVNMNNQSNYSNNMNNQNTNINMSNFNIGQQGFNNQNNTINQWFGYGQQNKSPAPINNNQFNNNSNNNFNSFNNGGSHNNNTGNQGFNIQGINNNASLNNFGFNNPIFPGGNSSINHNQSMDKKLTPKESEMKRSLIEEIRNNCEVKLKEDIRRLKSQEDKLLNYKQVFSLQNEKLRNILCKKEENVNSFNVLNYEIEQDIISKKIILEKFSNQHIDINNCFEFIILKNPNNNFLQLLSMEAAIEDMFNIIKRGFEKGNISFNETVKFIRNLSREAIKIKFIRDKITKQFEKK